MIYLDNNATTRPLPSVIDAVELGLRELWHNPSSVHRPGQDARHAVELARAEIAGLLGVIPKQITLTAGGTESIDLAVRGVIGATNKRTLITSKAEHSAVQDLAMHLEKTGLAEVRWIPLLDDGVVDTDALEEILSEDTALVSVQWANNETGVIQPVEEIARLCREHSAAFHCDGVQWVGKEATEARSHEVTKTEPPCDLLTFSAHKFHGPKGVGGLWVRPGVRLRPTIQGSQELGRRGGTENVPGILGAGVAATEARQWLENPNERTRLAALRDRFERAVLEACPGAVINGGGVSRLWNTTNIGFARLQAEALLMTMSERGLAASAGAACSSGSLEPSPVLLAMGVPPDIAHGSVRFSLSRFTTDAEIDEAVNIVTACVTRVGRFIT